MSFLSNFTIKIIGCLLLSLTFGIVQNWLLRRDLTDENYELTIKIIASDSGTLQFYYDFGNGFSEQEMVSASLTKGHNDISLPIVGNENSQLRKIRLDFGWEKKLENVEISRLSLRNTQKSLFDFRSEQIQQKIEYGHQVLFGPVDKGILNMEYSKASFDPHIIFLPLNELIYSQWQRTLLLVAPWILLLFLPILNWTKECFEKKEIALFLTALFLASIPLKIAWVTFTALLLLVFSLFEFAKHRKIIFTPGLLAIMGLFLVPLFFLGNGKFAELAIPLGFVIFPMIFSILDISKNVDDIKIIYTKVFFVVMSITIVSWLLLMMYNGYYYKVGFSNYFTEVKWKAHLVMDWLYYSHTTFLSFFILIGGIFCMDLFKRQKIIKIFIVTYACLAPIALLILGSRFAWALAFLLPMLYLLPVQQLKRILVPLWVALFAGTVYFIDKLDLLRTELWKVSFEEIKKNSWFGHGTGTSDNILPEQLTLDKNGSDAIIAINHSHNQFLSYLLENGIFGTLLITALLLFIFYRYARRNNKVMLLIVFSILFLMVVESPFKTATPLYLISFLLATFSEKNHFNEA